MQQNPERRATVLDMAYEIIDLHKENMRLRMENEDLKRYQELYHETLNDSIDHSHKMIGNVFSAIIDPNSFINRGKKAIDTLDKMEKAKENE